MDNYNNYNQGQQYNPYGTNQPQYNPYEQPQPQYNPYQQPQAQYSPYGAGPTQYSSYESMQSQYNPYMEQTGNYATSNKRSFITLSMILGLIGSIMLMVGLFLPAIDFAHFHKSIDIQFNLFKVGENVALKSSMWNVIPYAILVGIIVLIILSFVRIPILKILPILLIISMFVLMLVDMGNVVAWATELLDKFGIVLEVDITTKEIFKSLMPGIYVMIAGVVVALISCFIKIKED